MHVRYTFVGDYYSTVRGRYMTEYSTDNYATSCVVTVSVGDAYVLTGQSATTPTPTARSF